MIPAGMAESTVDTELEISAINSGFAQVIIDVKNIGTEIAEEIQIAIEVKGGFLGRIDILQVCSGCSSCGTTLDPEAIKTESTKEAGLILGIGPITISASASALNAPEVTLDGTGFVIGPFVIIN
jgi:2-methylaconitate cis-trans-isomerase PrpF